MQSEGRHRAKGGGGGRKWEGTGKGGRGMGDRSNFRHIVPKGVRVSGPQTRN